MSCLLHHCLELQLTVAQSSILTGGDVNCIYLFFPGRIRSVSIFVSWACVAKTRLVLTGLKVRLARDTSHGQHVLGPSAVSLTRRPAPVAIICASRTVYDPSYDRSLVLPRFFAC